MGHDEKEERDGRAGHQRKGIVCSTLFLWMTVPYATKTTRSTSGAVVAVDVLAVYSG